ncbi:MAG: 1,4-alpha-glucan branching enzyme, partial [Terriglobia bacterium]
MVRHDISLLSDDDLHFFNEGTHYRMYRQFGAHSLTAEGVEGAYFAVWAPNAERVCVMGDFNGWNKASHQLQARGFSGVWEGFVPGVRPGMKYKFQVASRYQGYQIDKTDPFAFYNEVAPQNASIVWKLDYSWGDREWAERRHTHNSRESPISIYEVHLGSWMRSPDDPDRFLSYRDIAPKLAAYVEKMGFTHVEL